MPKKILKYDSEKCIKCHTCEKVCSKAFFKEENVEKSCIKIGEAICNQCGECISACSELALSHNDKGIVALNKEKCVGCLICVGFCPWGAMKFCDGLVKPFKCIACGLCVNKCPSGALSLETTM